MIYRSIVTAALAIVMAAVSPTVLARATAEQVASLGGDIYTILDIFDTFSIGQGAEMVS